ncbi:hypothetical protein OXC43_gp60 [Klebsiella phage vB_KpP_FBKp27]|uniref:Uncharacterized protein n=1 Tax=Klebsiella phage vB_KpP_FBKp27 TaxID=2801837 RepID=A0A7U0J5S0_9CAUD|nr:hypothetical protein OXC43_gp60 [Klebsiella phage vB_KpP_FBKp27]QQV91630.1 hypothetical protein vBKpPFBKp27_059 [Klebsiella phage vB_KpP_FBKp27]
MKTWWLNRSPEDHAYLPECRSINHSNAYTDHEPGFRGSPRLLLAERNAKQALRLWRMGQWKAHWEDGIDIYKSPPHRKTLPMETVEVTLQRCLDGKPMVFVFGSNEAGIHGDGAAKTARELYGAVLGKGHGHYGNSYALPTKSPGLRTLRGQVIHEYVDIFLAYAKEHSELNFMVTRVGCGLAGLKDSEIAPMFKNAPDNCYFDSIWEFYLTNPKVWGTF